MSSWRLDHDTILVPFVLSLSKHCAAEDVLPDLAMARYVELLAKAQDAFGDDYAWRSTLDHDPFDPDAVVGGWERVDPAGDAGDDGARGGGPEVAAGAARGSEPAGEPGGEAAEPDGDAGEPSAVTAKAFDDPDAETARAQTDSLDHDLRMAVDPNIAARDAQAVALKAGSPLQAKVDQDSMIGLGLFDAGDQFRLDVDSGERSVADVLGDLDAEEAAIKAARDCL